MRETISVEQFGAGEGDWKIKKIYNKNFGEG